MSVFKDSLDYASKFEFIDSDDEDFVEKTIMKNALSSDTNSSSVRNAAAHAAAKKGLPLTHTAMDATLNKTKSAMQTQLDELKSQMDKLDEQSSKLQTIDNPDDAFKFMKESGMTEEDMEKLVKAAGMNLDSDEAKAVVGDVLNSTVPLPANGDAVGAAVDQVEEVASKIRELNGGGGDDAPDSDDEDEPSSSTPSPPTPEEPVAEEVAAAAAAASAATTELDPEKKKKLENFSKAIGQQKEQREKYEQKKKPESAFAGVGDKDSANVPSFTVDYTDSSFSLEIALPLAASMKTIDLHVSETKLALVSEEGYVLKLDWKQHIDDSTLKAKFSKKTKMLSLSGLLA